MARSAGSSQSPQRTSSDNTLAGDREHGKERQEQNNHRGSEQAEADQHGPPKPVGFFDPRLHKTRIDVAKKWVFTSKLLPRQPTQPG